MSPGARAPSGKSYGNGVPGDTGKHIPEGGRLLLPLQGAGSLWRRPELHAWWVAAGVLLPESPVKVAGPGFQAGSALCWNAPAVGSSLPPRQPRMTAQPQRLLGQIWKWSQTLSPLLAHFTNRCPQKQLAQGHTEQGPTGSPSRSLSSPGALVKKSRPLPLSAPFTETSVRGPRDQL